MKRASFRVVPEIFLGGGVSKDPPGPYIQRWCESLSPSSEKPFTDESYSSS